MRKDYNKINAILNMNKLIECYFCTQCNLLIKTPLVVSCGSSICAHHFEPGPESKISCAFCGREHYFKHSTYNRALEQCQQMLNFNLSATKQKNVEVFQNIQQTLEECLFLGDEPETFLKDRIKNLKSALYFKIKELKMEIDLQGQIFLNDLDTIEKRAENMGSLSTYQTSSLVNLKTKCLELKDKLLHWEEELCSLNINMMRWTDIEHTSFCELKCLKEQQADAESLLYPFDFNLMQHRLDLFEDHCLAKKKVFL